MTDYQNYKFVIKKFCDESTIHALQLINGIRAKVLSKRIFSAVMFLFVLCLSCWQCALNVQVYLEFNTKTSVVYTKSSEALSFPAITICNRNSFRRSIVSPSKLAIIVLSKFYAHTEQDLTRVLRLNRMSCPIGNETNTLEEFDENPMDYLTKYGFEGIMDKLGLNSWLSVVKCWWKGNEIDCDSLMFDHFTNIGMCFTVNPNKEEDIIYKNVFGESIEKLSGEILTTTTAGPSNSLQLLLNVKQDEYCGWFYKWSGAGFDMFIHDQTKNGILLFESSDILVQPGKSYDITIQPIKYLRKTEAIGQCQSTMILPNLNIKGTYQNSACNYLCYVKYVLDRCLCYPIIVSKNVPAMNRIFNVNSSLCSLNQIECFGVHTERFFENSQYIICQECKRQCSETTFIQTVSEKLFPSKNAFKLLKDEYSADPNENVQRNFLVLNIYFESMWTQTVTENQIFSITDLLMYNGSSLCLFLGMSLISWFEPLYIFVFIVFIFLQRCLRKFLQILNKAHTIQMKERWKKISKDIKNRRKLKVLGKVAYSNKTGPFII